MGRAGIDRALGDDDEPGGRDVRGEPFLDERQHADCVLAGRPCHCEIRLLLGAELHDHGGREGGHSGKVGDVGVVLGLWQERAVTDDGQVGCFGGGGGQRHPVHGEQRLVGKRVAGCGRVEFAEGQAADGDDGGARFVGQGHRQAVAHRRRGQAHSGGPGVGGVHADVGPGEREQRAVHTGAGLGDRMQGGVEQGRMHAVARDAGLLRQRDLGEDLLAPAPDRADPLEQLPVRQTLIGQVQVEPVQVLRHGTGRRPNRIGNLLQMNRFAEPPGRVTRPSAGRVVTLVRFGLRVDRYFIRVDRDLNPHSAPLREHQRGLDDQLGQVRPVGLVPGPDRHLDQRRTGHHGRPGHHVLGQPRLRRDGKTAGEDQSAGRREVDGRSEQRVTGGAEAQTGRAAPARARTQPVALPGKGVAGQVGALGSGAGEEARPVDEPAPHRELRDAGHQAEGFVPVAALQRDPGLVLGLALGAEGREDAVRAEFGERAYPALPERGDGVGEADGFPHLPHPVPRVEQLVRALGAGEGGDDRDLGCGVGDRPGDGGELLEHRLHERGVEGVRDPEAAYPDIRERRFDLVDRGLGTGDDNRFRTVDRGDAHALDRGDGLANRFFGGLDGEHRATGRQSLHQPAPGRHDRAGIGQGPDPGYVSGGQFTDGVPGQQGRLHAPGLQETEQRHLDREEAGLGPDRVADRPLAADHRLQREAGPVEVFFQAGTDRVEGGREDRIGRIQLLPHADPLRTLAGEDERDLADRAGQTGDRRTTVGQDRQLGLQLGGGTSEDDGAVRHLGPGGGQGPGQVESRLGPDLARGELGQAGGLGQKTGLAAGRDQPREHARSRNTGKRWPAHLGLRRLLQDHVRVGATEPEARHPGPPRAAGLRPGRGRGHQPDRPGAPVDLLTRRVHVQSGRNHAVPHRLDHLDDSGHPGRGLGVADVRLHRTQKHRAGLVVFPAVGRQQGLGLDRVAEHGPGAVSLHHVHVRRGAPGGGQGRPDPPLLGRAVGGGEPVRGAVLVHRAAPHHRVDAMPVATSVRKLLHNQDTHALAPAGAVGGVGIGLAAAVYGQTALPGEFDEGSGGGHHRRAAGQGEVALARAQGLDGEVKGDQGRGAGRVHGHRRAFQPEHVGHPAGRHPTGIAGADVALDLFGELRRDLAGAVVVIDQAGEHAGGAAGQAFRVDARVFQRFPGGLQQQALLRVHRQRLTRADPEEGRVEIAGLMQEGAGASVGLAAGGRIRINDAFPGRSAIGRKAGDRVRFRRQ